MGTNITFNSVIGGGSVTISAVIVYGSKFGEKRISQTSVETVDGSLITYDTGSEVVQGEIIMKNVSYVDGELLRTWLRTKAVYQLYEFTITTDSSEVDLGEGKGIILSGVKYNKKDTLNVFNRKAPGNYEVKFPYRYKR